MTSQCFPSGTVLIDVILSPASSLATISWCSKCSRGCSGDNYNSLPMDALNDIIRSFRGEYNKTPVKIQVLDCFLVYAVCTGLVQLFHLLLVGSFPFNSFLAGFLSCVAFCVLTVCLRMQIDPSNADFKGMSPERAFADYVLCNGLLHLVIWNFMG